MPVRRAGDDELIDLIYGALLGETSWQSFLDRLRQTLPGGRSTLFFHDAARNRGEWSLSSGFDEQVLRDYAVYYSSINPWMRKAAVRPVGYGVVAEQMLPRADFLKTEFYSDFLSRLGSRTAVGVTVMRDDDCMFMLSTLTARDDPEANLAEAARLGRLVPHLRRAFNHYRRGAPARAADNRIGSVFEALGIGLLIVGANAKVRMASPIAQRLLEQDVGLRILPGGRLASTCSRTALLLEAMTTPSVTAPWTADTVNSGRDGRNAVKVTLIRLGKDRYATYFEGPTLIVLLEPLCKPAGADIELLARHYRLTAAERRVVDGIVSGHSIRTIAQGAGLSRETIRNQLKSVYAKLGINRQTDLVRLAGAFRPRVAGPP